MDQPEERIEIESPLEAANPDEERYQQNAEEECYFNNLPNEIFGNIFRYLNYGELLRASKVCRRWLEYIYHEKDLRKRPYCFASSISTTATYIRESPIKPFVALFFLFRTFNEEGFYVAGDLFNLLPNCKTVLLCTHIISFNDKLIGEMRDLFLVCGLLPQISNVQINMVTVQKYQWHRRTYEYTQMIETAVRENHESMCLMLFCSSNKNFVQPMVKIAQSRFTNGRVFLCGVVVNQIKATEQEDCLIDCVALLITGRIRTWSIVLNVEERQSIEEKLQTFKQQVKLQKHTLGFVFFPPELLFSTRAKELTIFKKLFPNVPLIGCSSFFKFEGDIYEKQCDIWCRQTFFTFMILTYD